MKRPKFFVFIVPALFFIGCTTTPVVRKDTAKPAPEITAPLQTPRQLVPELLQAAANGEQVALVFGNEVDNT